MRNLVAEQYLGYADQNCFADVCLERNDLATAPLSAGPKGRQNDQGSLESFTPSRQPATRILRIPPQALVSPRQQQLRPHLHASALREPPILSYNCAHATRRTVSSLQAPFSISISLLVLLVELLLECPQPHGPRPPRLAGTAAAGAPRGCRAVRGGGHPDPRPRRLVPSRGRRRRHCSSAVGHTLRA